MYVVISIRLLAERNPLIQGGDSSPEAGFGMTNLYKHLICIMSNKPKN